MSVQHVFTNGRLSEYPKTDRSRRRVPLRSRVLDALDAMPSRVDTPILFPGSRGGHLELHNSRERHWKAALRAAGLEYRRSYDLRYTYATFSIAAGVSLFALARRMGTSLEMIDKTYGHLAPDADDYELGVLDAFDARVSMSAGHLWTRPTDGGADYLIESNPCAGSSGDAPGMIRTCDLCLRRAALYPLSYGRGERSV